jgi:hypothetical protein
MTFNITTLSVTKCGITTFNRSKLSITTLSTMTFSKTTFIVTIVTRQLSQMTLSVKTQDDYLIDA